MPILACVQPNPYYARCYYLKLHKQHKILSVLLAIAWLLWFFNSLCFLPLLLLLKAFPFCVSVLYLFDSNKLSWLSFLWLFILSSSGRLHVRLLLFLARVIMKRHVHLSARIKCNLLPAQQKKDQHHVVVGEMVVTIFLSSH